MMVLLVLVLVFSVPSSVLSGNTGVEVLKTVTTPQRKVAETISKIFKGLSGSHRKKKPDLAITAINRNSEGKLEVKIANVGSGHLPPQVWNVPPDPVCGTFTLYRNGKVWVGNSIRDIDKEAQLFYPHTFIVFTSPKLPPGTSKIQATLSSKGKIREKTRKNNVMIRTFKVGRPNLSITRLSLSANGKIQVGLKNLGPGDMPDQVWSSNSRCSLEIYRDGKFWAGNALRNIDPEQRLKRGGGGLLYNTGLSISDSATVKVVVDKENRVIESNELDNVVVKTLSPGQNVSDQKKVLRPVITPFVLPRKK